MVEPDRRDGVLVVADGLYRTFRRGDEEIHAVRDVSLEVWPGEFVAVIGRSGSGKTTLLNLLGGLDTPSQGRVQLGSQDLYSLSSGEMLALRRGFIGYVFQSFALLPLLSALENVELPLRINGWRRSEREKRAREALELVGLSHRARHRPYELSGGEQQRVAIARAVAPRPSLLLADEPTGELDSITAQVIFRLFRDLVDRERVAVLTATHDRAITQYADRIIELRDGALVAEQRAGGERQPLEGDQLFRRPSSP
ncbi:MAG: ABC transporter ATP-binding protein [Chloroflexi bacterium]|nr:ABC transporter ATP-binding protein [Chloroflexota bacterium]